MSDSEREKKAVISFGKGVRLMSEDYYIRELKPFGINTTRAFRALCRAICCPLVILGHTAFVDPAVFQLCIKHLSLPGNRDFLGPNSYVKTYKNRKHIVNRVNPEDLHRNWQRVVRSILDSRRLVGLQVPDADRASIRSAASELTRFVLTMVPSHLQDKPDGSKEDNDEEEAGTEEGTGTEAES
jgi:hypothetical protein